MSLASSMLLTSCLIDFFYTEALFVNNKISMKIFLGYGEGLFSF